MTVIWVWARESRLIINLTLRIKVFQKQLFLPKIKMETLMQYFNNYNSLSEKALNAISEICKPIMIKKNKDLQPIGHTCKTIYFIIKGATRIYFYKNDSDVTECFVFENNIIARVKTFR